MSESVQDILEKKLSWHLGKELPANAVHDIHAALELSEILESKGFSFQLKDLCPKSMHETGWRAVFSKNDENFSADNPQSELAVCMAAVGALTGSK